MAALAVLRLMVRECKCIRYSFARLNTMINKLRGNMLDLTSKGEREGSKKAPGWNQGPFQPVSNVCGVVQPIDWQQQDFMDVSPGVEGVAFQFSPPNYLWA